MAFVEYKGDIVPYSFEDQAIDKVLDFEGGYNPKDAVTGMPVNYGIDQKANPDVDVTKLTKSDAANILKERYWKPSGAGDLPKDLALVHFDAAVNQGNAAKRFLEESGGDVNKYLDLRREHYIYLAQTNPEKYGSSLKGWLNRLDKVEKAVGSFTETPSFAEYTGEVIPVEKGLLDRSKDIISKTISPITGGVESLVKSTKRPGSVLEGTTLKPDARVPAVPSPDLLAAYDAATPEERVALAESDPRFKKVEDFYRYKDEQKAKQTIPGFEQFAPKTPFDTRYESRVEKLVSEGVNRETAEGIAKYMIAEGLTASPLGEVKEQPPEADITESMRIKPGMTGIEETAQVLKRSGSKAAIGVAQGGGGVVRFLQDVSLSDSDETTRTLDQLNKVNQAIGNANSKPVQYLENAVSSIAQQLPALTGGAITGSQALVLTSMFAQSFGQTYDETRREGFDVMGSTTRASAFAAFEVLGEKFGLGDQLAGIRAAAKGVATKDLSTYFARALVKEIPGEELTYAGQFAVDKGFGLNPEAGIKEFIQGAVDTMATTAVQSGIMLGTSAGISKGVRALGKEQKVTEPPVTPPQFRELGADEQVIPTEEDVVWFEETPPVATKKPEEEPVEVATPEEAAKFAEAPSIDITGVGEVPAEEPPVEAPKTSQDIAAMMAELEEKAPQAPVEEPKVEEPKLAEPPVAEEPKATSENIINLQDKLREKGISFAAKEAIEGQLMVLSNLYNAGIATDADLDAFEKAVLEAPDQLMAISRGTKILNPLKDKQRAALEKRATTPSANEPLEPPKVETGKAVSVKDMAPEDQKSIRELEVEKNKIGREKKLFPDFLARQGVQPSEKKDLGLEGISRPRIFRVSAPTFDELTSRAISEGFLLPTGDDVQDVANMREHVANYIGSGVITTGPDTAREAQMGSIDDAIAQIYRKYDKPAFGLEETTPEKLKAEADRKKAEEDAEIDREMAEKARQSKEEIKRRSEAAATEFELGRTAEEDLTGQKRLDDPDADIPFFSVAKKKLPPGRNAELAQAAQKLRDGDITKREYDAIVKRLDPSKLYAEVPTPASDEKMTEALDVNKREKIHPEIADGQRVGTRLDIPAARKGAFVVSIHQPRTPSKVGQVIGYDSTAVLNDVVFATGNENKALEIASGGAKDVLQTIEGSWQNVDPAEAERMAREAIDSPDWVQVGVNPTRHSYFYDRDTMEPVVQADQIIQIGNLVLAKNPTYASKESFLFAAPADLLARQDERIREELRDEKIAELQSVKQRMAAIQRRFAEKKLKPLDQDIYAELKKTAADLEEAILDLYEPNMTPEAFLAAAAKSLANRKDGITQDVYDVIHKMFKKNPKLLDGLRLSVSSFGGDRSPQGEFKPYKRMVYLYKGTEGLTDPRVIMHEINHSLEQMMTRESRKAVVSHWRQALERAAKNENSVNGIEFFGKVNEFIRDPNKETFNNAIKAMPDESYYQYINPSEYWAVNSEILMQSYLGGAWQRFKTSVKAFIEAMKDVLGMPNRWIIYKAFDEAINGERKNFSQMNDYIRGVVPMYSTHTNFAGGPPPLAEWTSPDESKIADFIYKIQDKFIDVKDVQKAIVEEVGSIEDRFNAYMKEELYHGRTAKRIEDFLRYDLLPIIKKLSKAGIDIQEFDDFLHNRHAEERNKQIAKVNPNMPDAGSGIKTADAQAYFAGLDPKQRATMESIAKDVDNMIRETQKILVDYGVEEQSTIDQWNKTYKHYVPLMRDDLDFSHSVSGLGQGLATRGKTSKRATGSLKDVVDIFANLAIQRERAIIRGEKSRVGKAFYGLAIQNPNPEFWLPVNPDAIKDVDGLISELISIGLSPEDARNFIKEPYTQDIDPKTGLVTKRVNVNNRYADNVFSVRVNGKDRFIFFNPSDPRAMRMVKAMKNMDAEQFSGIVGNIAKVTRFIASVNTQYNPVFGAWNFTRDVQGAAFNLSTTAIAGKQKEVMAGVLPAWTAIYRDLRAERKGKKVDGEWVDLFERYERAGAKTGYRDQFAQSRQKANIIEREMKNLNRGNVRKVAGAVMDWLSDYNDAMENAVRLSAFKVALDQGLSEDQAASLAKNLTVNFNRKGAWSQGFSALYAFFNASVQGSARILETLRGPAGKKIIAGGMLIGVFQALALMMAGFDEDEPPEFLKDKNLLIPYGDGKYAIIPMPLGFSALPGTGRRITEMVLYGNKMPERVIGLMGMWMDAFNPMGNGSFAQMLSPTSVDPFVSADMNRDSFGRPIYKKDKETNPSPGYERSREGASDFSKGLSYLLNYISSGGSDYQKGIVSPTADQIDYVIGQYTGGVGREVMKAVETVKGLITGEEVPPHRKPVIGKILGDVNTPQAITGKFYRNITDMAQHENEIKGRSLNDEDVDQYIDDNPESSLYKKANDVENRVNEINKKIKKLRDIKDQDNKDAIKDLEESKVELMKDFNDMVREEKSE